MMIAVQSITPPTLPIRRLAKVSCLVTLLVLTGCSSNNGDDTPDTTDTESTTGGTTTGGTTTGGTTTGGTTTGGTTSTSPNIGGGVSTSTRPEGNKPPVVSAGSDSSVLENSMAVLNGTDSKDPDNDNLTYVWKQTSGPDVVLSGADKAEVMFTAPSVDEDTELGFSLSVSDEKSDPVIDMVTLTVLDNAYPVSNKRQEVMPASPEIHAQNGSVNVSYTYGTFPAKQLTSGLVFAVYWDSSKLTFNSIKEKLATNYIGASQVKNDSKNEDLNANTDKYIVLSWADITDAQWPSNISLPTSLFTASFASNDIASTKTRINIKPRFTGPGYTLQTHSIEVIL